MAEVAGPSIDDSLAWAIDKLIRDGLPETRVQDRMNLQLRPVNTELLSAVRVNTMIWHMLNSTFRLQDIKLQKIHTFTIKAMI